MDYSKEVMAPIVSYMFKMCLCKKYVLRTFFFNSMISGLSQIIFHKFRELFVFMPLWVYLS